MKGWVPCLDHARLEDWTHVYEPAEDTFLLLDALYEDRLTLSRASRVVEMGSGSGVVATYVARLVEAHVVAVDINAFACALTARTAAANDARVDVVKADLPVLKCDALIFNPPYVTTPAAEVGSSGIEASWAGGARGRAVIDRLLALPLPDLVYLLVSDENDPHEIVRVLEGRHKLTVVPLASRRARNERLRVLRGRRG